MSEERSRSIKFVTPRFSCLWAKLGEPDTKFNKDGVYSVSAVVDPNDPKVAEFLRFLDSVGESALNGAKEQISENKNPAVRKRNLESLVLNPPYEPEYDKDGMETGKVIFKLKSYATKKDKNGNISEKRIPMCDARRIAIDPATVLIGNGSILCVRGTASPSYIPAQNKAFVTLYIDAVQLIELVEFGGNAFGDFDEVDGYYGEGSSETSRGEAGNPYTDGIKSTTNTFGDDNNGNF